MKTDLEIELLGKTVKTYFQGVQINAETFNTKGEATLSYWTAVSAIRLVEGSRKY